MYVRAGKKLYKVTNIGQSTIKAVAALETKIVVETINSFTLRRVVIFDVDSGNRTVEDVRLEVVDPYIEGVNSLVGETVSGCDVDDWTVEGVSANKFVKLSKSVPWDVFLDDYDVVTGKSVRTFFESEIPC